MINVIDQIIIAVEYGCKILFICRIHLDVEFVMSLCHYSAIFKQAHRHTHACITHADTRAQRILNCVDAMADKSSTQIGLLKGETTVSKYSGLVCQV